MEKIMQDNNIKIKGYKGTWYIIGKTIHNMKEVYLLEHEQFGDETPSIIVDNELNVILDDVYNGFDDLYDME